MVTSIPLRSFQVRGIRWHYCGEKAVRREVLVPIPLKLGLIFKGILLLWILQGGTNCRPMLFFTTVQGVLKEGGEFCIWLLCVCIDRRKLAANPIW